jgi:hypothetical protein
MAACDAAGKYVVTAGQFADYVIAFASDRYIRPIEGKAFHDTI